MDKARRMRRWARLGLMPATVLVCMLHAYGMPMMVAAGLMVLAWGLTGAMCVRFARPCWTVGQRRLWQPRKDIWRAAFRAASIAALAAWGCEALYGEMLRAMPMLRFAQAFCCVAVGQWAGCRATYRQRPAAESSIASAQKNALIIG